MLHVNINNGISVDVDKFSPQTMDIVDMVIHPVVCQKSDFLSNSGFQNSQKLNLLQIPAKIFLAKIW
jgi:hypothetical protein